MHAIVDSLAVNYFRKGKGRVVVLLHGWGDDASGLRGLQNSLSANYDTIALDLPGFGGTDTPAKAAWGLNEYANFVANFCKKLSIEPYALIGHSNGGAIALRGLAQGHLQAKKLVLLASAGIRGEYKGRVKALRIVTKVGKGLVSPLPKGVKKRIRGNVYKTIGSDMLVAEHLQQSFKKIVSDDVRDDAKRVSQPALLIYGEVDNATPSAWGKKLAERLPNSKFIEVPSSGHFVHIDSPDLVVAAIEDFLQ